MGFDRTKGQEQLETVPLKSARGNTAPRGVENAYVTAMVHAAASPVHGCWDEAAAEEPERWDGLG